jgi:hypothetical protein
MARAVSLGVVWYTSGLGYVMSVMLEPANSMVASVAVCLVLGGFFNGIEPRYRTLSDPVKAIFGAHMMLFCPRLLLRSICLVGPRASSAVALGLLLSAPDISKRLRSPCVCMQASPSAAGARRRRACRSSGATRTTCSRASTR